MEGKNSAHGSIMRVNTGEAHIYGEGSTGGEYGTGTYGGGDMMTHGENWCGQAQVLCVNDAFQQVFYDISSACRVTSDILKIASRFPISPFHQCFKLPNLCEIDTGFLLFSGEC